MSALLGDHPQWYDYPHATLFGMRSPYTLARGEEAPGGAAGIDRAERAADRVAGTGRGGRRRRARVRPMTEYADAPRTD